jgi:predicted MPP superfamily phosphohydrolase
MTRRRLKLRLYQKIALALSILLLAIYYVHDLEPSWIEVRNVSLSLPNLAPEFSGYRIVQLSDIHADRRMTAQRIQNVVGRVNEMHPDLVVLTGDFVTRNAEQFAPNLTALNELRPVDKSLAVLGNHDAWTNPDLIQRTLETAGVQVLNNRSVTLERPSAQLHIAGVDDIWAGRDRLNEVLAALPATGAAILLAHEPDFADTSAATGRFDLQLSGHSHGGQIYLPFMKRVLPPLAYKYPLGQYQVGSMIQYTNRGLGSSGIPIRFNCRPEITIFTLKNV